MLSSLQCGVSGLPEDCPGVLFTPVDYPSVLAATIESLVVAFGRASAPVVVPQYGGRRGHPVVISRGVVSEILALPVSGQAREVIRRHRAGTVFVDVDDPGILADVDRPEDYRRLTKSDS
jgi:CTP:molybdopterin cytidylyltransferase MocA